MTRSVLFFPACVCLCRPADDPTLLEAYSGYADSYAGFPEIDTIHENDLFELAILQFEEGESIELHDHPGMTGVILCVSGDVTVDNFDLLEEQSSGGGLLLERVANVRMIPGQVGTLTADRGNIHTLQAHTFTQLLDVFTPPYTTASIEAARWFQRAQLPYQGRDGVYEAWEVD